jgi:hypothetical protein
MNMHYPDFMDQDLEDGCECPTCLRPMPAEHDYECGTCEAKASEHLRVTTLCKLLRASQARESALIVELGDAKATADLWIQKAKQADEAANDLVAELIDTRREWKEELERERAHAIHTCHDQCQKPMCVLRRERDKERALADRLAGVVELYYADDDIAHHAGIADALTAWKEARSE